VATPLTVLYSGGQKYLGLDQVGCFARVLQESNFPGTLRGNLMLYRNSH